MTTQIARHDGPEEADVRRVGPQCPTHLPAGEHHVIWDRRTTTGDLAKSGIYYYRVEAGSMREQRKMVLLP